MQGAWFFLSGHYFGRPYRVWCPVIQYPAQGRPTIVGGLPPPLPRGRIRTSPRGQNSCPYLPIIPISALLCTHLHSDGAGSAAASTLSPVRSPIIPSGVICSVCRDSIISIVVVVVALKISTLCTSYHQLPPRNKNIGFGSCFACSVWTNWQSRFSMKWTLEWELRFKRVHFCTTFWQQPYAIYPKTLDPVQSCN